MGFNSGFKGLNSEHGLQKGKCIPEQNILKSDAEWKDNTEIN